jgi:predicted amidohydrolase YtcJ
MTPALVRLTAAVAMGITAIAAGQTAPAPAELIVRNASIHTMDAERPQAGALAVADGRIVAVGDDAELQRHRGEKTLVIDAGGRCVIPGLNDSHLHVTRGGRFYNLELRWDGVTSLERGLAMIQEQAARTPSGQWVRVVGGWSPSQFSERRMPTLAELNVAAPQTPVFVLFLYSQAFVNRAGMKSLGITADTMPPEGGRFEVTADGVILHAEPRPTILYQMIDKLPHLSAEDQVNSTRQFYRELNRFGVTSAVDAGGGGHAFPQDYAATESLAADSGDGVTALPLRISFFLFAQKPGAELQDYQRWTTQVQPYRNLAMARFNAFMAAGAGENLVWAAGDFENFMAAQPQLKPQMEDELAAVARLLVERGWPMRIHATYDESVSRILDVFERVDAETSGGVRAHRLIIDHAETISDRNIERLKRLGGGVAVQNRMAFAGEFFAQRYGAAAAGDAPPLRRLLDSGIPLGGGTDATRVSSFNPWLSIAWMVTGKSVGGTQLASPTNRLTREEALRLWTVGSAWFSREEEIKGRIAPGQLADFAILDRDYFSVPEEQIGEIQSLLTVVGGTSVHAVPPFDAIAAAPSAPPVSPAWSPVAFYGGYQSADADGSRRIDRER